MEQVSLIWLDREDISQMHGALEIYYTKNQFEERYYSFIQHTLKDAENGLVICIAIYLKDQGLIGFSAISCSAVRLGECEGSRVEYSLYKDHDLLPAIQIDLFVLARDYRRKGYGKQALEELLKYLISDLRKRVGFKYITTLSTSREFTNLAKKLGFEYLLRDVDVDELKEKLEAEDPYLCNVIDGQELMDKAKELRLGGLDAVWLFLECE